MVRPLFFLETSDIGARYCAEAAEALGFAPVFFCELGAYDADPRAQLLALERREVDTTSIEQIVAAARREPLASQGALITLVDSRLVVARGAAQELGLPGLDPAVVTLKSKARVAELVPDLGPPSIAFTKDRIPLNAITCLLRGTGKVIVKPAFGAGARGLFVVDDARGVAAIPERIAAQTLPKGMDSGQYLAQVFVDGAVFSLEGYALGGKVVPIGFTDRKKIGATECESVFPVDAAIPERQRAAAVSSVELLLGKAGFANGYFHVELIVDADRTYLIDANVGRLGGGPVGELLAFSYDVDPAQIYQHFLEVTLLHTASRDPYARGAKRQRAASVLYGLENGGTLVDVELPKESAIRHTQLVGKGKHVSPMGTDDWSWVGILTGLEEDARRSGEQVRIRTTEGVEKACH